MVNHPSITHHPLPSPYLTIKIIEFTYCKDIYSEIANSHKHDKYDILIPHLQHLGWITLRPIIITTIIRSFIHKPSITHLLDLEIPHIRIKYIMENISFNVIKYLTYTILKQMRTWETTNPHSLPIKTMHFPLSIGSTYWEIGITPSSSYIALQQCYDDG